MVGLTLMERLLVGVPIVILMSLKLLLSVALTGVTAVLYLLCLLVENLLVLMLLVWSYGVSLITWLGGTREPTERQ